MSTVLAGSVGRALLQADEQAQALVLEAQLFGSRPQGADIGLVALRRVVQHLQLGLDVLAIGAGGVLVKRNPLVILLCLELMLNAANLALIAFARMHGNHDGQIFAIIVMVVAACEVVVGLGLIVAIARRHLDLDVDRLRVLRG